MFANGCVKYPKDTKPVVKTGTVSDILAGSAVATGSLESVGSGTILQYGHCWSSANDVPDLRIHQGKTALGTRNTTGSFRSNMTGLYPKTGYYVRAYLVSDKDTLYGNDIKFFTTADTAAGVKLPPNVATLSDSAVAKNDFYIRGNLVNTGTSNVTRYGHCYSRTQPQPTTADSVSNLGAATAPTLFTSHLTNLPEGTRYYVRAYATNATGTAYGVVVTVTTAASQTPPAVATLPLSAPHSWTTATTPLNGKLTAMGMPAATQLGHVWSATNRMPTVADSVINNGPATTIGNFVSPLANAKLRTSTTYYYRAFATNASGTVYGTVDSFKTGMKNTIQEGPMLTNLPESGVAVACNGKLYYGLGRSSMSYDPGNNGWNVYDPNTGNTTVLAAPPQSYIYGSNGFEYGGEIYVVGGFSNFLDYTDNNLYIQKYTPATNSWSVVLRYPLASSLSGQRFFGANGFLIGTKYYFFGGISYTWIGGGTPSPTPATYVSPFNFYYNNLNTLLNNTGTQSLQMFAFDLTSRSISVNSYTNSGFADMGAAYAATFTLAGKGYVVGGISEFKQSNGTLSAGYDSMLSAQCWEFDPQANQWSRKADFPGNTAYGMAGCAFQGMGYVFGGAGNLSAMMPGDPLRIPGYAQQYSFNPATNSWRADPFSGNMPAFAKGFVVPFRDFMLLGGGLQTGMATGFLDTVRNKIYKIE